MSSDPRRRGFGRLPRIRFRRVVPLVLVLATACSPAVVEKVAPRPHRRSQIPASPAAAPTPTRAARTPSPAPETPAPPVFAPKASAGQEGAVLAEVRQLPGDDNESRRRALLEPLVRAAWPEPGSVAGIVGRIHCESRWWPWEVSSSDDHGLAQLHAPVWRTPWASWSLGPWNPNVYGVRANILGAYHVYREAGGSFRPWVCDAS